MNLTTTSYARLLRAFVSGCVISSALLAGSRAAATGVAPIDASADQKKQAVELFTAGKEAVGKKDFDAGIDQLRRSLDIVDSPNTRLILSRALRDAGKPADAWAEYGRTITSAKALAAREPKYAAAGEAAAAERSELEGKVAFVVVNVSHAPEGMVLKVGGSAVPADQQGGPIPVAPGSVDIVVENGNGAAVARKTVTANVGEKTPVALDASPPASGTTAADNGNDPLATPDEADSIGARRPAAAEQPPPSSGSRKSGLRTASYIAGGVGVVGLGTFAIAGLLSNSSYNDLQSACHPGCPADKSSEISSGKTEQTLANVGLIVGAVGVVTGVTLFVLSSSGSSSSSSGKSSSGGETSLVIGPTYLGVRGSL